MEGAGAEPVFLELISQLAEDLACELAGQFQPKEYRFLTKSMERLQRAGDMLAAYDQPVPLIVAQVLRDYNASMN